jgi:enoyl-CoA hydratase/carnithine racemase
VAVVERDRRQNVEVLTINRPEARNAINGEVSQAMSIALDELEADKHCWAIIITGAGDKAFSAGMDLKAFAAGELGAIASGPGGFGGIAQRDFSKPVIAAVNGAALAGGCEIMLSCDMVVAAEHATFGIPEVKRGLIAGAGGLMRLPRRLPLAIAMELGLTGEPMDAQRAYQLGLVNRVVPAERLLDEALHLAGTIAANAPTAVRWSKRIMKESPFLSEQEGWKLTAAGAAEVFSSPDALEGAVAFAEKRPPKWQLP